MQICIRSVKTIKMKTSKVLVLFSVFSAICLINSNIIAGNTGVDSVYNIVKGTWYKVYSYSGLTGNRDSIFNSDSTVIVRIADTDSIFLKDYKNGILKDVDKYQISFSNSILYQSNRWMFKNNNVRFLLSSESFGFSSSLDAFDGGGVGYSRSNFISGIIESHNRNNCLIISQNPTHDLLRITGISQIHRVDIRYLNGKLLRDLSKVVPGQIIDISNLHAGIYIITVTSGNDTYTAQIIKTE